MIKFLNFVILIIVDIDVLVVVVWEVLIDFLCYGEWNMFCIGFEMIGKFGDFVYMQICILGMEIVIFVDEIFVVYEFECLLLWE